MATATFATITRMSNLASQLNNTCNALTDTYSALLAQMNAYLRIQDPAFPDDPTQRIWHTNMLVLYTPTQLAALLALYNHVAASSAFWYEYKVTEIAITSTLSDITPQLDTLIATIAGIVD